MTDTIDLSKEKGTYDNKYEVLSMLPRVELSLKKNITQDYPLAHLDKDAREFIIENYANAEYAMEILNRIATKGYNYEWDPDKNDWKRNEDGSFKKVWIGKEKAKPILDMGKRIFEFFMIQPHLIAILNRNNKDNFMVKMLGKFEENEEKGIMYSADDRSTLQKIKEKISGEPGNET